jgi:hypothetical protein
MTLCEQTHPLCRTRYQNKTDSVPECHTLLNRVIALGNGNADSNTRLHSGVHLHESVDQKDVCYTQPPEEKPTANRLLKSSLIDFRREIL